nr:MAG TPA: hypothetical protein [Siphoviridae sp. ctcOR4]
MISLVYNAVAVFWQCFTASQVFDSFNEACETFIEYHADFFNLCTDCGSAIEDLISWAVSWLPVIG